MCRWWPVNICQPHPYHPYPPTMPHWWLAYAPMFPPPPALPAILPQGSTVPANVWWVCVTCHVCICGLGRVCTHACVYALVRDTSAALSCYPIDMSVCEALLFSDVPHTGSWSLCVCACAWLPSSVLLETDGPWHLPFGRFSLWKMSSSSDPTCVCLYACVCACFRVRERWCVPQFCLPEVELCSWLNNGCKLFDQPGRSNLCVCVCGFYIGVVMSDISASSEAARWRQCKYPENKHSTS